MCKELSTFIKNVRKDYRTVSETISKKDKRRCYRRIIGTLFFMLWSGISAPIIYPIWYLFRRPICKRVFRGTSWQEIEELFKVRDIESIKSKIKTNGRFFYWLWTYGDRKDPLGRGDLPKDYLNGKNTFWNRFRYCALRNPRYTSNYLSLRTGVIEDVEIVIDTRNFNIKHRSYGIGDVPDGMYFKWMKDTQGKWYFIYEDNNEKHIFYIGYVGLLYDDIGRSGGRFETSRRKTDDTYISGKIMII